MLERYHKPMKKRILASISIVSLLAMIATTIMISVVNYNHFLSQIQNDMVYTAKYLQNIANIFGEDELMGLNNLPVRDRITIIDPQGQVTHDNQSDPATMDDHSDRPEIINALKFGTGNSTRHSDTLEETTYYYAVKLDNGHILRLSVTQDSVLSIITEDLLPYMVIIILVIFALSLLVANYVTKKLVMPLNTASPEDFTLADIYPELSPFVLKIKNQGLQINSQLEDIKKREQQFSTIVENIGEGFILVDSSGEIMFINTSAIQIMGIQQGNYQGKPILEINRSLELNHTVQNAFTGVRSKCILTIDNRQYEATANPISLSGKVDGVVLLFVDITEKRESEQLRREFSANVSHELKTPLTSISGYAEIMKNGLVKPEDVAPFAQKIYNESNQLIQLIQDIIRISRLDEGSSIPEFAKIELQGIIEDTIASLEDTANGKSVTLSKNLSPVAIMGVPQIVREIIFNLCDNAIKYNREGGSVNVSLHSDNGKAIITVKDTGIGIPVASQERVFERFYRVDKSHSKETGGTGLGLSIVKHSVELHKGSINLQSSPEGTVVTITIPEAV